MSRRGWWAVLLAGGSGTRMGADKNKVLLPVAGLSCLVRSARALAPYVEGIVSVCRREDAAEIEAQLQGAGLPCDLTFTEGGDTRQASVFCGLNVLPEDAAWVLIHDAARCLVDAETITRVQAATLATGAAMAAMPVTDTIKLADAAQIETTVSRDRLWSAQTPQGFAKDLITRAHQAAQESGLIGTDDASLVEAIGAPVQLVQGHRNNLKLTTPEDLRLAEALLSPKAAELRIGFGLDVHRLTAGRKLVLCGVEIPHELGLDGHSDADVATHALMDALLGACSLGDIGQLFPDHDDAYLGISSLLLLAEVGRRIRAAGFTPVNVDLTICAQRPRLMPHIPAMRQTLAQTLELPVEAVSVKATTTERLGFEGREEGISAQAVAMVRRCLS